MTIAPRFDVKIGINPISWFNDDPPTLGGETPLEVALTEGSEIGYRGFEPGNKFPREPRALREVLSRQGLELVSGWYSGRLVERSADEEIAAVMVYGEVSGSIQGERGTPLYARPRFTSDEQWRGYAKRLDTLARFTLSRGVRLAYHHPMGACVETPDDVDRLMALTSHDVGLLFDSAHAAFGASRARFDAAAPAALLARHIARVCHVHCKDVRAEIIETARNRDRSFLDAVINGAFTVPGDGAIDFQPLIEQLRVHGYRGWLVVEAEQDPAVAPSYTLAQAGFRYLHARAEARELAGQGKSQRSAHCAGHAAKRAVVPCGLCGPPLCVRRDAVIRHRRNGGLRGRAHGCRERHDARAGVARDFMAWRMRASIRPPSPFARNVGFFVRSILRGAQRTATTSASKCSAARACSRQAMCGPRK